MKKKIDWTTILMLVVILVCQVTAIILKTTGVIDRSWWIVFLPTILPIAVLALGFILIYLMHIISYFL